MGDDNTSLKIIAVVTSITGVGIGIYVKYFDGDVRLFSLIALSLWICYISELSHGLQGKVITYNGLSFDRYSHPRLFLFHFTFFLFFCLFLTSIAIMLLFDIRPTELLGWLITPLLGQWI